MSNWGSNNRRSKKRPYSWMVGKLNNRPHSWMVPLREYVLLLGLCLCLTASLWGCGVKEEAPAVQRPEKNWERTASSKKIYAPLKVNYITSNPLDIKEVREGDDKDFVYVYLKISGLKDQEIQKKINDRIKSVYDQLRVQDLPPYRGIKVHVPEGYQLASEQIYTSTMGSFNNILSVMLDKTAVWQPLGAHGDSEDKSFYDTARTVSEIETLNFDLTTGEELNLADLFCDNVDPAAMINNYMSGYLSKSGADAEAYYPMMFSGNMKLVEAFKGLHSDQKFGVYPFGLILVFDYNTPAFETQFAAATSVISYSDLEDVFAFTKRFYDENQEEGLYTSSVPAIKSLIGKGRTDEISGQESFKTGNVDVFRSWRYSGTLPEKIKQKLEKLFVMKQDELDLIDSAYQALTKNSSETIQDGSCEIYVGSYQQGSYINVTRSWNFYVPNGGSQKMDYYCFDAVTLKELELKDLFRKGFDFKPLIIQAIRETLDVSEQDPATIETLYSSITGFNLSSDEIFIPVKKVNKDGSTYELSVSLPYAKIGCDNLVIFH